MSDIPLPDEKTQPRSRWRVLLRPWVLISLTVVMFLVAAPLVYRSTRFTGIPPIGEVVSETDQPPELESEENAFTFYQAAWDRKCVRNGLKMVSLDHFGTPGVLGRPGSPRVREFCAEHAKTTPGYESSVLKTQKTTP